MELDRFGFSCKNSLRTSQVLPITPERPQKVTYEEIDEIKPLIQLILCNI